MAKEILRGLVLWGRCLIWAVVLAAPFVWVWQAHPGPGQELSPLWEWLEADSSVQSYAKIIVVVIGLVWFVSGIVFLVGSFLKATIDLNLATAEEALMDESDHAERTRERLLMQEDTTD